MSTSARRRGSRAHPPGGRGGVQPPLLNQVVNRDGDPPSPPAPARKDDDLVEALRREGVRVTRAIMRDFASERIWAAIEAYQEVDDAGPGLLVWMVREGCEPRAPRQDQVEADWLERRMQIHAVRQERAS